MEITRYEQEIITRSAPRWVWELIDETLAIDAESLAFDKDLRQRIGRALDVMVESCEQGD